MKTFFQHSLFYNEEKKKHEAVVTIVKIDDKLIRYEEDDENQTRPLVGGNAEMLWGYTEIKELSIINITQGEFVGKK